MGKVVETTKKKKKGRPSLLDLQKRAIIEQQQQQLQKPNNISAPHSNPNSRTATPVRRSTRRNPYPDSLSPDNALLDQEDHDEGDELAGKRREKKLKLVLKLPTQKSSLNSSSLVSSGSDSNAEENSVASNNKKRKINAFGDGSNLGDLEKGEKSISGANPTKTLQGTESESGPSTPLPDEKLLLFILERLQKKDTYGVFSEPVDPEELPDYREIIENPMDFGTVRKKLGSRAYATLEQFEKDIFLICSNAMQYNSPDTIYFRQARTIQELAQKNFKNLRQDSDDNEPEPRRRGRPPTKHLKQPPGRPSLDRANSEFSDATLATGGENANRNNYDLRKVSYQMDKPVVVESSGRFPGTRNNDSNTSWMAENKLDRSDDFTGSMPKSYSAKNGKRQTVPDENRRNTYNQFHLLAGAREPSVLNTFGREKKQLMPVGLHSEHGYARSLARFTANLGPVAWRVASKKIEKSLPDGVNFGPGWVGENDVIPQRPLLSPSAQGSLFQPFPGLECSSSVPTSTTPESNEVELSVNPSRDNLSDKSGPSNSAVEDNLSKPPTEATTSTSSFVANRSLENAIQPRPPFQIHQSPIRPGMNGYNGSYGFNLSAQMGKLIGSARPFGNFQSSQMLDTISRTNTNFIHPATAKSLNTGDPKFSESQMKINSGHMNAMAAPSSGLLHSQQSWQPKHDAVSTPQNRHESVPPDLNVRFQSPGSPSSSRVDSTQPDLALQL